MREIRSIRQDESECFRRWFSGRDMDLYVWEDASHAIVRFQLCYALPREHALTWERGRGFTHDRVDDGHGRAGEFRTPVLVPDGAIRTRVLSALLHGSRHGLDPDVYAFVSRKIEEYESGRSAPMPDPAPRAGCPRGVSGRTQHLRQGGAAAGAPRAHAPRLALASLACAAGSVPAARLGARWLGPRDDPLGFGGLGIALTVMIIVLALGVALSLAALRRGERPWVLAVSAAVLNGAGLVWVIAAALF